MKNRKVAIALSILLLIATLLTACSNSTHKSENNSHKTEITAPLPTLDSSKEDIADEQLDEPVDEQLDENPLPTDSFEYDSSDEQLTFDEPSTPYVSLYCELLDLSFAGYENKTGSVFFNINYPDEIYYIHPSDSALYYYGTNEAVIGVRNNEICLVHAFTPSMQIREVINEMGALELFEITPAMCKVANWYNTQNFFYWQIDNGYIGFIAIGGDEPSECYGSVATSLFYFEDLNDINVVKPEPEYEIEIAFAPEDYRLHPNDFKIYQFEDTEYGEDIVITPTTDISNFKFFMLDGETLVDCNEFMVTEILFTSEQLTPSKPFITRIYYGSYFGPYYGISYTDTSGNQHNFVIYESGEDGSFYLEPI